MDNPRVKFNVGPRGDAGYEDSSGWRAFLTGLVFCVVIACIMLTIKLGLMLFG
jgi:hypothetical protein